MSYNLKVSSKSVPHSVAGAVAGILRERDHCDMQVIGAGALNQAIKAIAIARTYVSDDGFDIACLPEFSEVTIDGQARTAIRILVVRYDEAEDRALAPVVPVITRATDTALGQAAATEGPAAPSR